MFGFSWSLRLFRIFGVEVRADWTLLLVALIDLIQVLKGGLPWYLSPVLLVILFGSVLMHEFGHVAFTRWRGGRCSRVVLWALGGWAECDLPMRPGARFLVALAGPLVNGLLWLAAWSALRWAPLPDLAIGLVAYTAYINARLALINCLPCFPLDGGCAVIAAIWGMFGLRRGVRWGGMIGAVAAFALLVWAVWIGQIFFALFAAWLLMEAIRGIQAMNAHESVVFGLDLGYASERRPGGWWQRMGQRRAEKAAERGERAAAEESALLDRLLDKVTNEGLPALTSGERAELERISRRRRERENVG